MIFSFIARLFFSSRNQRETRLGYVAEYCRICRKILPYEILQQRMAYHVFFLPIEPGQFLRNLQICPGCRSEATCNIGQFTSLSRSARVRLDSLIASTQPKVIEQNKEQLAIAELLATGPDKIDSKVRLRLLQEAFGMAEPHFRVGYGHHGRRILALMLRPLSPNADEIRGCLELYSRSRMATHLSVEEAMALIYPEFQVKDPSKFSY